ncbi:hypothetical protein HEN07_018500 [Escherichia coli]|nr:hypothetical protein [Escherichia coli]
MEMHNILITAEQLEELMSVAVQMQRDSEKVGEREVSIFAYAVQVAVSEIRKVREELTAAHSTLEKAREVTNFPQGVDLQDHLKQLVAENLTMIRLLTDISENHVEYFSEGEDAMFAGVPLDYVSEINMYVSHDVNAENPFPATDSILREAEARGVEKFASDQREIAEHWKAKIGNTVWIERSLAIAEEAEAFSQYLRVVKA